LALLRRIVELFPCGELQFDVFNRFGIRTQITNAVARRAGARLNPAYRVAARVMSLVPALRNLAQYHRYAF
jgi:hypothetical protein